MSSWAAQPEFYLDENIAGRSVLRVLRDLGYVVHTPTEFYGSREVAEGTRDEVWLADVSRRGWTVVSRDTKLLERPSEPAAYKAAKLHDPSLVYASKHAGLNRANLAQMRAVQGKRLTALGYDEWRATVETPIALLKIDNLAYSDKFADIDIAAQEVAFYREVYGLDEAGAKAAIEAQKYVGELEVK